jgi:hypothetical protein
MFDDPPARRRWPRSQRFSLSETGTSAASSYLSTIIASRTAEGRASYDAARASWATEFRIQPDDGLYLAEIRTGPVTLGQLVDALETCGKTRKDAIAAVERLVDAGLVDASSPEA